MSSGFKWIILTWVLTAVVCDAQAADTSIVTVTNVVNVTNIVKVSNGVLGSPWSIGMRRGYSATSYDDPFYQTDLFVEWDAPARWPWRCSSAGGWYFQHRLTASVGDLTGQHEVGFIGSVGGSILGGHSKFPIYLDVGFSPTILSREHFGRLDFGYPLQFISHGGFYFRYSRVTMGYRFQHMSNAGIHGDNPGLNLHMVGIGYHF